MRLLTDCSHVMHDVITNVADVKHRFEGVCNVLVAESVVDVRFVREGKIVRDCGEKHLDADEEVLKITITSPNSSMMS